METGTNTFRRHDSRQGLGYGLSNNRFHVPRKLSSAFPYLDEDPYQEEELDDPETKFYIDSKLQKTPQGGAGDKKSVDPFYFVAGNTKLSDCFFRFEKVISEITALSNSLSPVPNLYKGPVIGKGAAPYLTTGSPVRKGSKKGFSSSPPVVLGAEEEEDDNFYDLYDLSKILRKDIGE